MTDPRPDANDDTKPAPQRRGLRGSWPAAIVLTQAALVLVLAAWVIDGRPIGAPGAWAWMVKSKAVSAVALVRVLALGAMIIAAGALGLQRIRARRRSDAAVVAGLVLLTFALQLSVLSLAEDAGFLLIAATASSVSTEYFDVAWGVRDVGEFVRAYAADMTQGLHHVATHPPGAVIFYWLCIRLYQSPLFPGQAFDRLTETLVGSSREGIANAANTFPTVSLDPAGTGPALFCCLVLGACGALALVPIFHVARAIGTRAAALSACVLFALSPAPILFFQGLDSLLLLMTATALALMLRALRRRSLLTAGSAGLLIGVAALVSFGTGAAAAMLVFLAVIWAVRGASGGADGAWSVLAAFVAGTGAVLLVGHVACGMSLHVVFAHAMAAHRKFTWHRLYGKWLVLNGVEFACFVGLPVCVVVVGAAQEAVRRGWRRLSRADLVGVAAVAVLVGLCVSGSVRGEVGRVWLFMMPPLVLWAGHWLSSAAPGKRALTFFTAALTMAQLVFLGIALTPVVMPF